MKNINDVLHKLAETRLPCPTFIMDELERLYYEAEENGMATALLEADILSTKNELTERDRTIAQYHTLMGEANEQSDKLIKEYKELATERDGLRKALEEIASEEMLIGSTPVKMRHIARKALGRE